MRNRRKRTVFCEASGFVRTNVTVGGEIDARKLNLHYLGVAVSGLAISVLIESATVALFVA